MNANTPQAHLDNARNKLTALLDQLCAAEHATTATTVESITKVANTLHYLCQPSAAYGYSNAAGPSPEVGESPSPVTVDASPEPAPTNTAVADGVGALNAQIKAVVDKAALDCRCPLCVARRANESANDSGKQRAIDGMSASVRVVEIPINGDIAAAIARAVGLSG